MEFDNRKPKENKGNSALPSEPVKKQQWETPDVTDIASISQQTKGGTFGTNGSGDDAWYAS